MKLKNLNACLAAVAVAAIIFTGCQKEISKPAVESAFVTDATSTEISVLAEQADNDFMNATINGGTETEAFSLNNDGLPEAYTITEASADGISGVKRDAETARIVKCLHNLDLSAEQVAKIRRIFKGYEDCKHSIIVRHANASKDLLVKYNNKRDELLKALRNGRITKAQFEAKMKELRKLYNAEKEALALKARAALKDCYTHMLRGLNGVLTEKQWKAFIGCYQH